MGSMSIDRRRFHQVIALFGALSAYATIVLGGAVRGLGAGLSCPDWPLCNGSVIPNLEDPLVAVEYAHRLVAALTSVFLLLTFALAVLWFRPNRQLVTLSFVSAAILTTQVAFGALTITERLDWGIVTIHLALGTATFASSLVVALATMGPFRPRTSDTTSIE